MTVAIPPDTVSLSDYERHFDATADPAVRAYVSGYAADGITDRANRTAFDRLSLLPRILRNLSGATSRMDLFGETLESPILLAPTAFHKLVHPDGELATVAAAGMTKTLMVASTQSSICLEDIARNAGSPLWFQLYCQPDFDDTLALVRRAEQAGYRAIVLTADALINGIRNLEQRAGFRMPEHITAANLSGMRGHDFVARKPGSPIFQGILDAAPTWRTLERLCTQTSLPVLVKGVLHPDDARLALEAGARGIVVSNHGGRVLDTVPAAISMLPRIVERVGGNAPVLVDGGIRRGTDVLKAIALGASAVLLGRPVLHALAVGGSVGVAHLLTILQTELEAAMALCGVRRICDIDRSLLLDAGGGE